MAVDNDVYHFIQYERDSYGGFHAQLRPYWNQYFKNGFFTKIYGFTVLSTNTKSVVFLQVYKSTAGLKT